MTRRLLRGRVLGFLREPEGAEDTGAFRYHEDGAVLIASGRIEAVGDHGAVAPLAGDAERIDHRPHLICPGFIDAHIHAPQVQVIASWGAQLIDWLNTYTFPAETAFADPAHAAAMAGRFLDLLLDHGTTTAAAFCSVHSGSADALFAAAECRGMRMIAGKVLMDRNAPDGLRDCPRSGYDDTKALIARWHGRGRALYAITPRFAITSSPPSSRPPARSPASIPKPTSRPTSRRTTPRSA
jgi:guanine deaminase